MKKWFKDKEIYKHKSYDFREKKRYKGLIIVISLILISTLIIFYDTGGIKTTLIEKINEIKSNNFAFLRNINNCPEGIIPEKLELNERFLMFEEYTFMDEPQIREIDSTIWKDGQRMDLNDYPYNLSFCNQGYAEGENINLVYCKGLSYSKTITPVSKDGIIGKTETISYTINLILQKENERIISVPNIYRLPNGIIVGEDGEIQKYPIENYPVTTYKIISTECKRTD